jgi:hypothetical protein
MSDRIEVGFQAFISDGQEEFGAIRATSPTGSDVTVYVENSGDFVVPFGKVTFDCKKLDASLRRAIGHAHDVETL